MCFTVLIIHFTVFFYANKASRQPMEVPKIFFNKKAVFRKK